MPAQSKAQQALMTQVYLYLDGKLNDASDKVKEIAKGMSKRSAKDFASTKTTDLPKHVTEAVINKQLSFAQFVKQLYDLQ